MEKHGLIKIGSGKLPKSFWDLPRPKDPQGWFSKLSYGNGRRAGEEFWDNPAFDRRGG
jgi:hypothetical protein